MINLTENSKSKESKGVRENKSVYSAATSSLSSLSSLSSSTLPIPDSVCGDSIVTISNLMNDHNFYEAKAEIVISKFFEFILCKFSLGEISNN